MSNHGLRGHETVIRLVGKRRKLTLSAISPKKVVPQQNVDLTAVVTTGGSTSGSDVRIQSTSARSIKYYEEAIELHTAIGGASKLGPEQNSGSIQQDGVAAEKQDGYTNWVQCPICAKSIRGDVINTHLDICLQGGVKDIKRKSKQLTMSQFGGTTFMGKLSSSPHLPAGFQRLSKKEKQRSVGSVKLEAGVRSGSREPPILRSQGRDNGKDEKKPKDFGSEKLEDMGAIGPSQSVMLSTTLGHDIRQTRMTLKCLTTKDPAAEKKDLCCSSRNGGSQQEVECSSTEGATVLVKSEQVEIASEEPALNRQESGKDTRHGNYFEESKSSVQLVSDWNCSCHCHLPTVNGENMDNGVAVEDQVVEEKKPNYSDGSIRVVEKTDRPDLLETVSADSRNGHFSDNLADDVLVGILDTKIVGRRFNRGTICMEGMEVTVLREPDNPKDVNAIKVVQSENPEGLALGHLAREISLHLSSMLDKGLLHVRGSVTAVPEQTFGAVPIKLFCESTTSKEDFLNHDGAEATFQKILDAVGNLNSLQRSSSGSASKYQQNFTFMLQTVLERDSHLFTTEEKAFLETFSSLSDDAQRLFIRLYQRKGPWFRLSTIEYKDVADVDEASEELIAAGYITAHDSPDEDPEAALMKRFDVLNVMELRQFVCNALMKKKSEAAAAKKEDLVNMAVSAGMQKHGNLIPESPGQSGSTLIQVLAEIAGKCIRISDVADFLLWRLKVLAEIAGKCIRISDVADFLLWRLKRLFFLNGDTDLSAFLVVDMGLVKYPRYKCWRARNIFETREGLLAYEQALEVAQGMDMALEVNDAETALKLLERARRQMHFDDSIQAPASRTPTFLARFSASYVYRNVCTLGVSILERERRYPEAVDVLRQLLSSKTIKSGRWGYWTVRLSMDLDHLGRKEESLQVAEEGVNDPWIRGGDRVALQRRVVRLGKPPRRWKTPPYAAALKRNCKEVQIQGRPLNCVTGVKSWFYGYDGQQCRVEELALQYFASEEGGRWHGVHCEGGVWMTFFGLLMWDVLFADVPDVFQTSFQTAPLDLDTEVFFSSRQTLIEAQLVAIAQGDTAKLLARTWNRNMGTMCRGVNWERHSLEELQTIASCIGGPGLSTICRLLAEDHAGWTAGMPDLLLWRTPTPTPTRDSENLVLVSTDSRPCTSCGCNPETQETCSMERSMQGEERAWKYRGGVTESFNVPSSLISTVPTSAKRGEAKLVEVKGPRDRLSEQQRAWIWILMNAGLSVEVCKVLEGPTE